MVSVGSKNCSFLGMYKSPTYVVVTCFLTFLPIIKDLLAIMSMFSYQVDESWVGNQNKVQQTMSMVWGIDFAVENFSYFWPHPKKEKRILEIFVFFSVKTCFCNKKLPFLWNQVIGNKNN
jgi:hypothetical protein